MPSLHSLNPTDAIKTKKSLDPSTANSLQCIVGRPDVGEDRETGYSSQEWVDINRASRKRRTHWVSVGSAQAAGGMLSSCGVI